MLTLSGFMEPTMRCQPIGFVKSPMKQPVDKGRGRIISDIYIDEEFAEGLKGIESFSHVIVVFVMHRSTWNPTNDLVRGPQGRPDMPLVGDLFPTRETSPESNRNIQYQVAGS